MADLTLTLGGVVFQDFEVPERITGLGGGQILVVQQLVGGDRDIQALGRDDASIQWTGRFRTAGAVDRARAIDAMRVSGQQQTLTFGDFAYSVVIEHFTYELERFYEVPYSISLLVVQDNGGSGVGATPDVDQMLGSDDAWAGSYGDEIGDDTLTGLLDALSAVIGATQSFAMAPRATLQATTAPIAAAQARVGTLIAADEATLSSVSVVGGVDVGATPATLVSGLLAQVAAMTRVSNLYALGNVLGRMATNIAAIGGSGSYVTVAGSDLYRIAEQAYGDATEWATIAAANGITDPVLSGVQSILVPPLSGQTAGVLAEVNPAPAGAAQSFPLVSTGPAVGAFDFTDPANSGLVTLV